jgi:alpha-D-ribose 1-methylphosphonate 5-triphosphate synthase subunit PhnH
MNAPTLVGGFADPVIGAQETFRCILTALSRPGVPVALPQSFIAPSPLGSGMAVLALTLLDGATPTWLDEPFASSTVRRYLQLRTDVAFVDDPAQAAFALIDATRRCPPLAQFNAGDVLDPHVSATLLIAVASLSSGAPVLVTGPGIEPETVIAIAGLSESFWPQWDANAGSFPRGVDILFTDGARVCGLPRTTRRL